IYRYLPTLHTCLLAHILSPLFLLTTRPPPRSTLFPYTTLFRSFPPTPPPVRRRRSTSSSPRRPRRRTRRSPCVACSTHPRPKVSSTTAAGRGARRRYASACPPTPDR